MVLGSYGIAQSIIVNNRDILWPFPASEKLNKSIKMNKINQSV
jgi:hypothetical protein